MPYRCPHRLNLSSESSLSCARPNIKPLKDKDLEFANSIRTLSLEIDTGQDLGEREHPSKLKRDNHIFDYCIKALQ